MVNKYTDRDKEGLRKLGKLLEEYNIKITVDYDVINRLESVMYNAEVDHDIDYDLLSIKIGIDKPISCSTEGIKSLADIEELITLQTEIEEKEEISSHRERQPIKKLTVEEKAVALNYLSKLFKPDLQD